jgi:outer membrane receptor protein involved in Fe transport
MSKKLAHSPFYFAAVVILSSPVALFAQETEKPRELEEIIVTGSRIPRAGFDTMLPATVIDSEFIGDRGFTNIADALNEIPSFGLPAQSTGGDQDLGGVGQSYADFFGLGSQRTLTLVNGRRFVSSNAPTNFTNAGAGLQVDLSTIPTGMIERVETVAVGGAPIYGADAIAGTVNVILKRDYEGFSLNSSYGVSGDDDLEEKEIGLLWGSNFSEGRGNLMVGIEWTQRDGLIESDRDFLAEGWQFREPADPNSEFDRVLVRDAHANLVSRGGVITPGPLLVPSLNLGFVDTDGNGNPVYLQFGPDGTLIPYDVGQPTGNTIWSLGGEGIFLPDVTALFTPIERTLISSIAHYELNEYAEIYGELFVSNANAREAANQPAYQSGVFGNESFALLFPADHPLLTPAARTQLASLGMSEFWLQRASVDLRPNNNSVDSELFLWRAVGGLRGDVGLWDRTLSWDVSYNVGKSDADTFSPDIDTERFFYALDVVLDAEGQPACRVVADPSSRPTPGAPFGTQMSQDIFDSCVPLNLFGEGSPSDAAVDYISAMATAKTVLEQQVASLNLNMDVFEVPAGDFAVGVGYEHREEEANFKPGGFTETGRGRSVAVPPIAGNYRTDEVYTEFFAPVVNEDMDIPFVASASVEGAFRRVFNSFAGTDNTWTIGGRFSPIADVEFRGNVTESVRAPAAVELFLPLSGLFSFANDPCDQRFVDLGPNPGARRANCIADGIADPDNFTSTVVNASAQGRSGGNTALLNEKAEAWTVGMILRPRWVDNLTLAIDYVEIDLTQAIENFTLTQLMESCYDQADFPNEFCDSFTRLPNGQLPAVNAFTSGFVNAGLRTFRGTTIDADWSGDLPWGQLHVSGYLYLPQEDIIKIQESIDDAHGEIGNSDIQAQLNLRFARNNWSTLLQTRYIGEAKIDNEDIATSRDVLTVDPQWLINGAFIYDVSDMLRLQLNVNNVFDEQPDPAAIAAGDQLAYDNIGRFYRLGMSLEFQ